MPVKQTFQDGEFPVKVWTEDLDKQAEEQLRHLSGLPFIHHHVAAMADAHGGMGSTIGSVIPTMGAIIPAAVGVDLGCGMMAVQLDITASDLPDSLRDMRTEIESRVPHGRTDNGGRNDRGAWGPNPPGFVLDWWNDNGIETSLRHILERHPKLLGPKTNTYRHLGTLGTGNHFIEVCIDESQGVWVMLHSGSRGIGNRIGSYFITQAKEYMGDRLSTLPDKNLAWLDDGTELFRDYVTAVGWAQHFALINREVMMRETLMAMAGVLGQPLLTQDKVINCHHNYVAMENHYGQDVWVTRKGAIRAGERDMGIIPGSMGKQSYIVRGKGSAESFHSCSHGAGRSMSRTEARKRFTAEDLAQQTKGVECRKDIDVVDEIPGAYKDIDQVMANQTDLVEVVHTLKQVLNVKG